MRLRSLTVALVAAAAVLLPAAPALAEAPTDPRILGGWAESGGENGPLGDPVGGVVELRFDGGVKQEYEGGAVFWSSATGSHAVYGPIWSLASWGSVGPGVLGFPTAGQVCGLRNGGCSQEFEHGAYYSVASIGEVARVWTEDRAAWSRRGGENGPLGYPVEDIHCGGPPDYGCLQQFQNGALYRPPAPGAYTAVVGPIYLSWSSGVMNVIGHPTADQVCGRPGGGCTQTFRSGAMYWSPATGATYSRGAILSAYKRTGAEGGRLGYPTTGEVCGLAKGGCLQLFWNGGIYWSPSTGAHPVDGLIRGEWSHHWSQDGRLGYPTTDDRCGLRGGGCFQEFQGGAIYSSPATGAQTVLGAIRTAWAKQRWETGPLGYPTWGERCGLRGGGCFQDFQGGTMYWSPASGAHAVSGGLAYAWAVQGREVGRLGYPVSGATLSGGAFRQTFQGGTIAISARGTSISYR